MLETPQSEGHSDGPSFHFVFGLRPQTEPFHVMHYLCLRSCRNLHPASEIHFHYRNLPHGAWWDRIAPELVLHQVDQITPGFKPSLYKNTPEGRFIDKAGLRWSPERTDFSTFHGGLLNESYVRNASTTYARLARTHLEHDAWQASPPVNG